jgi:two-component system copper resistance phosphate regulon response regulator CusR
MIGPAIRRSERWRACTHWESSVKVLVVEDDPRLLQSLQSGLAEAGFRVDVADEGRAARLKLALGSYDAVVLDVKLPGQNGFELCDAMRADGIRTPVLFLTAQGTVDDRVEGLTRGGDDYLTKPFSFRELIARLRALGRRPVGWLRQTHRVADLAVDLETRTVTRAGQAIPLTTQEWALFEFLVRNQDRVVGRDEITAYVWDDNHDPFTNLLEVLVWRLRRKVDDGHEPKLIHTVRGSGYRFGIA